MTAAVLYGTEDVRIERIPVPPVGPGEVRLRIEAALTCGTDVKVYRRGYHARMITPPAVFGHEMAGTVEAIGDGVEGWAVGQRAVVANSAPCGDCFYCRRGRESLCEDLLFLNGAYAEYITVPARIVAKNLLPVPAHVSCAEAALCEPLACAVRGMHALDLRAGDTVAVVGAGPIGLMFVRLCALAGAQVIAVGRRAERLALARELGAAHVIDAARVADTVEAARGCTEGGRGAEIVIEAAGSPTTWEAAIAMARKGGTVSLFGGCPAGASVPLDTHRVHYDELTLLGTFHHTPTTFREALALISSGDVPAHAFLQREVTLGQLPATLAALADGSWGAVKTVVQSSRKPDQV